MQDGRRGNFCCFQFSVNIAFAVHSRKRVWDVWKNQRMLKKVRGKLYEVENMAANEEYWKETAGELAEAFCEYTGCGYYE